VLAVHGKALAGASTTCSDHERRSACTHLARLDRNQLTAVVDPVRGGDRLAAIAFAAWQQTATALTIVGALLG
jgi:hypothetical protein